MEYQKRWKVKALKNLSNEITAENIPNSSIYVQEVDLKVSSKWVKDLIADQKF